MDELKRIIDYFKNKNNNNDDDNEKRKHSLTMLAIYGIFLIVVIIFVRVGSDSTNEVEKENITNEKQEVKEEIKKESEIEKKGSMSTLNDVNYGYMYTVTIDGVVETYIGKRIDDKEKFSYSKNDEVKEYAIKDDNYFILDGDTYHIIDKLNNSFKYCDVDKVLLLIENIEPTVSDNMLIFNVENKQISRIFNETMSTDNSGLNTIIISTNGSDISEINLDFSNYISSLENSGHTMSIKMEFVNVGTVEDFTIKLK